MYTCVKDVPHTTNQHSILCK